MSSAWAVATQFLMSLWSIRMGPPGLKSRATIMEALASRMALPTSPPRLA